jgi:Rod binding domain-containing protein
MDASKPVLPQLPPVQAPEATAPKPSGNAGDARKAAENFEAFFLAQSLDSMFAGIDSDSLFGGGSSENVYRSLLNQEYAKVAAKSGGVGIADEVQREILRMQEVQKK